MNILKNLLKWGLRINAQLVLRRRRPLIVGVTGSVGKTSTRAALEKVLQSKYRVRKSQANFNNEFGLPFTVLGIPPNLSRIGLWFASIIYFFRSYLGRNYPKVLVLEMGADRPGDLGYLTKIARPHVAVVTKVGHSHTEFFGDLESVQKEKANLVRALSKDGIAVLNEDDPRVAAMKALHKGKTLTYGFSESADVRAENYHIAPVSLESTIGSETDYTMHLDLIYQNKRHKVVLAGVIGRPAAYAALAAFAVGESMDVSTDQILDALANFEAQPGRLRVLAGIKHTLLIDDTYNASPESTVEALKLLKQVRGKRKIAVLGDMLELGPATEKAHRVIGKLVADLQVDLLFTVGARAKFTATEARNSGIAKTKVKEFEDTEGAGLELQNRLKEGDAVLIKGSQGMRMEKIVEEVMAEPGRAGELLCRQSKAWKKKSILLPV